MPPFQGRYILRQTRDLNDICNAHRKAAAGIESMRGDTSTALYKRRGVHYAPLKEPPQAEQK
jgi:hypothetical protein